MLGFSRTPERFYDANITRNPLEWMGIWTPEGWRVHKKRWGRAERVVVRLSGDGRTTLFPGALRDPDLGEVAWADDLHLSNDVFTDDGIYPCDPRVEFPPGRPRWAVSHTLLCYPVADHTLYTHEYEWNLTNGDLTTRFRRHVAVERAVTDSLSGRTVKVKHVPLSTMLEGNVSYNAPNSAVRGVWDNPLKRGENFYAKRTCRLLSMANGVYAAVPQVPVVQCHGLYATAPEDPLSEIFTGDSGRCDDLSQVQQRLQIPCDAPRLGMLRYPLRPMESQIYQRTISTIANLFGVVDQTHYDSLRSRLGARFEPGRVGYAANSRFVGSQLAAGYLPAFDFNDNGVVDDDDAAFLQSQLGRTVRYNLYLDAYFGGDWVSTSCCLEPEHRPGVPLIADYVYGGGYDASSGLIHLLATPGRDRPVWVEYHYDAPAEPGQDNIHVHLYRERR